MESAFRVFTGTTLELKRTVVAAPAALACDVVQQRLLDSYRTGNEKTERTLSAHDARTYEEVRYLMIAMADEAFLQIEWPGRPAWAARPLEAQEFQSHDAGERFFRTLDDVFARAVTKPPEVLLVYLHALSIGFKGCYAAIDRYRPEDYRKRLVQHLTALGLKLTREPGELCPDATRHTVKSSSRLKLESLSRGWLPLVLTIVAWLLFGLLLFEIRTSVLSGLLDRLEAIR